MGSSGRCIMVPVGELDIKVVETYINAAPSSRSRNCNDNNRALKERLLNGYKPKYRKFHLHENRYVQFCSKDITLSDTREVMAI
ncbi:hypothetical protein J6590_030673 [Homalodisca vitripennis]|nr:hypothetical protein J6590_030673 [Homalodisca vitripennis]